MRAQIILALVVAVATPAALGGSELPEFLRNAPAPRDYVLVKAKEYPVVILGEGHWIRHDVEFVRDLLPDLARERITLVTELLPADRQESIDRLIASQTWDPVQAMAIMRSMAWPYREYLEILHRAWSVNRRDEELSVRVVAAGPPSDWRARGIDYDAFMADRVLEIVEQGGRVLFYTGLHHGFTRYYQPELTLSGTARAFMDRAGNILRRRLGERVFLITLHRPFWCGNEPWDYFSVIDIVRFSEGKAAEHWGVSDMFSLMTQLGVISPD